MSLTCRQRACLLRVALTLSLSALVDEALSANENHTSTEPQEVHCVGVIDGDTLTALVGGHLETIRLEGIDAPEKGAPYSQKAKSLLAELVFHKSIVLIGVGRDRYNRLLARVLVDGLDVSAEMVKAGLAWHYRKYSDDPVLDLEEEKARVSKRGLWGLPDPRPPWERRPATAQVYRGQIRANKRSGVYHAPWCRFYSCANCTLEFSTPAAAKAAGHRPGKCLKEPDR